jgi:hypothetical protein
MHCVNPQGQRLMARDFGRQVAALQVLVAGLNGYTAPGIPITMVAGLVCPGTGAFRPSADLRNKAELCRNCCSNWC